MKFKLRFTSAAEESLNRLKKEDSKKHKKVLKTLGLMEVNLRHPSLNTHKYESIQGPNGEEVFEAYVENKTPAAFRVFWFYGPNRDELTITAITPHP
ncbi:MAG: hypothetical protein AAF383_18480 [Cyanobacteria bacterium P01_A01_bin.83]